MQKRSSIKILSHQNSQFNNPQNSNPFYKLLTFPYDKNEKPNFVLALRNKCFRVQSVEVPGKINTGKY